MCIFKIRWGFNNFANRNNSVSSTIKLKMESQSINFNALLPVKFKYAGYVLAVSAFLAAVLINVTGLIGNFEKSSVLFVAIRCLILAGLFLVAVSQDKVEDELVGLIRLKAFELSFRWGVLYVIIDSIFPSAGIGMSGFSLVFSMLILYLLVFNSKKKHMQ
jgi:predicted neutral ceramidase superfamily lipid hydrolase